MPITVEQVAGRVPISVLTIEGDLDYANYQDVINRVQELYGAGTRHVLMDLAGVSFMGSSGLVALHSAALIMGGRSAPDGEAGWQAFHDLGGGPDPQTAVRLLGLQPRVQQMLERTALLRFFLTYTDRDAAIAAF